jgi:molybdate transport system substrate-binding protein
MSLDLYLLSGGAAAGLVNPLKPSFESENGCVVHGTFSAVGAMKEKLLAGEPCDVVILTQALIEGLIASGHVRAGSLKALGIVKTGIAVKHGSEHPPIKTREDLQNLFRASAEIYFPDPQLATAGIHFLKVLKSLGLDVELADRFRMFPNGATAMREMSQAQKSNVVGCTQVTEIKYTAGIDLVGLLPKEFELATVYALGISTHAKQPELAQKLADLLTGPTTRDLRASGGFEF